MVVLIARCNCPLVSEKLDISQNSHIDSQYEEIVQTLSKTRLKRLICGAAENIQMIQYTETEQKEALTPLVFSDLNRDRKSPPIASKLPAHEGSVPYYRPNV